MLQMFKTRSVLLLMLDYILKRLVYFTGRGTSMLMYSLNSTGCVDDSTNIVSTEANDICGAVSNYAKTVDMP